MQATDRLYIETLVRVGPNTMRGVDRLLDAGHNGLAEAKAVEKMVGYVRDLENQLGIMIPTPKTQISGIKYSERGTTYYV